MARFVVILLTLAAALYLLFWILDAWRGSGGGSGKPVPRGPVGPDDDPEFLRDLDWHRRRPERRPHDRPEEDHT